ncbi:hypothetical protein C0Q70_14092 [Pomacea canaliculata]|uniref:Cysteine-rich PDZ-binding protein n=1 Tax=Pomacea canaliculata TaxID=400727 RepID=A0A2T7NZ24_POMCA|nr:hypothetical protein C0Q70_14092 [Pomacea canaliculata]
MSTSDKCQKKLGKVITPDPWKSGARNTTEGGGRVVGENKALTAKKNRFNPYSSGSFEKCRVCKSSVHQPGSHYCQGCAYKKEGATYQDSANLEVTLFRNYSRTIRPTLNQSEPVRVNVTLQLLSVLKVDNQRQELSVRCVLLTQWLDQLLIWSPAEFGGLEVLHPDQTILWAPRVNPMSPEDDGDIMNKWITSHQLLHTGLVTFRSSGQLRLPCYLDMTAFPFDTQTCSFSFMVQDYTEREVTLFNDLDHVLMNNYVASGEWDLVHSACSRNIRGQPPLTFSTVDVTLVFHRLSGFYVLNLMLPFLFISGLVLLTFLVPVASDERVNFALSVLLSQVDLRRSACGCLVLSAAAGTERCSRGPVCDDDVAASRSLMRPDADFVVDPVKVNSGQGLLASVNSSRTVAQTSVPNTEGEKRTSGSDAQLKFTPQRASHKECEGRDEAEKSVQLGQAEDADELVNDSVKQNILKKFDKDPYELSYDHMGSLYRPNRRKRKQVRPWAEMGFLYGKPM